MSNDESEKNLEEQNIEKQEIQQEQIEERIEDLREAELPPTPQDIDMPTVKPPKEDNEE